MLIARAKTKAGNDLLIIGLSQENRDRLDEGRPVTISAYAPGKAMSPELHIVIFSGEDEDSMEDDLTTVIDEFDHTPVSRPKGVQ